MPKSRVVSCSTIRVHFKPVLALSPHDLSNFFSVEQFSSGHARCLLNHHYSLRRQGFAAWSFACFLNQHSRSSDWCRDSQQSYCHPPLWHPTISWIITAATQSLLVPHSPYCFLDCLAQEVAHQSTVTVAAAFYCLYWGNLSSLWVRHGQAGHHRQRSTQLHSLVFRG